VKIQLKSDDNQTQSAQAASAKVENGILVLRSRDETEVGRFNMDRVQNWWIEPEVTK
jgi:hypothetical protein